MRKILWMTFVMVLLFAPSSKAKEVTVLVTPSMVSPCAQDAPNGCFLLTIPLSATLRDVRVDRATLTLDVNPGPGSGISETGFGIIRVGLPGDLTADDSGTERADVKSVPIRAEGRLAVTIDILRYIRQTQDGNGSVLRLVVGMPNLDGATEVVPDLTVATVRLSYADRNQ